MRSYVAALLRLPLVQDRYIPSLYALYLGDYAGLRSQQQFSLAKADATLCKKSDGCSSVHNSRSFRCHRYPSPEMIVNPLISLGSRKFAANTGNGDFLDQQNVGLKLGALGSHKSGINAPVRTRDITGSNRMRETNWPASNTGTGILTHQLVTQQEAGGQDLQHRGEKGEVCTRAIWGLTECRRIKCLVNQ